jgi:Ser/Thr protein kinase RdoA (MazF antagonist)
VTYDFIKKRHALFETPEDLIFDLAKRAVGAVPIRKKKIIEGNDNEVYDVETDKGNFIIRIHRFGSVGYKEEKWALEQCKKQGIPVPEVLLTDTIELDGKQYDAMVQNKLRGKDFRKIIDAGVTKNERERVLFAAGGLLKKMHSIQVSGFYRLNGDGQWDFRLWETIMDSSLRNRLSEKELITSTGFTEGEFREMMRFHTMYAHDFPCRQPVLCHGDYTPEHWFVDDN